jgi:hypothetical protein
MEELSARAKLVDRTPDVEAHGLAATVSRHEIEEVLQAEEGEPELLLDVTRSWRDDGQQRVESRTVAVEWERADLERLLKQARGDTVTLAIDREALKRALEEDVEAHSLRERALVLTVAAATGAFAAGTASGAVDRGAPTASEAGMSQAYLIEDVRAGETATPAADIESVRAAQRAPGTPEGADIESVRAAEPAPEATPEAYAIEDVRGGQPAPGTPEAYAIEDVRGGQPAPEATPAGDEGVRISAPSPAEAAGLAGAAALAIAGAAFVARGRRQPRPT